MDSISTADTTTNIATLTETLFIKTEDNEQVETKPQIHLGNVVRGIPGQFLTASTNAQSIYSQVACVPAPPVPDEILARNGKGKRRPQTAEEKALRNARLRAQREARTPEEVERDKEKWRNEKEKARLKIAEVGVIAGQLPTTATTSTQSVSSQVASVQTPVPAPATPLANMEVPFPIRQPRQRRTPEEIMTRNGKRRPQTAEEKARRNAKLKAQRDARTPEEVERDREKLRQRRLQKLALMEPPDSNETKPLTTIRRRTNLADKPRRKALARRERTVLRLADPEQAKEIRNEKAIRHLNRLAAMSEEELEEYRRRRSFQGLARMANMSKEERADFDLRAKEWRRKWYENLDEEKYKRHYNNIRNWLKRRNAKMKEEDPEKYKALLQKHYENMRAARKNWTEEDWKRQRIRYRIAQRTQKLKKDKLKEAWSEEDFNRRVEEMKTTLWKELYPEGKPPTKYKYKGLRRTVRETFTDDQFICLKCFPKWNEEKKVWKPAGFKTKIHLLRHVRMRHKSFFFPCSYCEILKYSKFSLDVHLKVCLKRKSS